VSIWCSWEQIGTDYRQKRQRGEARSYALGWSNHYPDRKVERPASIGISHIPSWCTPGHEDEGDEFGEWLRLGISTWKHDFADAHRKPTERAYLDVVLDEEAARSLVADLTAWLDRPKVRAKR
jgi:hypothetical protein